MVQAAGLIDELGKWLAEASTGAAVAAPEDMKATTAQLIAILEASVPEEWLRESLAGDFHVIDSSLDQMESAVRSGEYSLAESARMDIVHPQG
jgi:high-affinity iron transporter